MLTRILLLAIAASTSMAFAEDLFLGTWKLNIARSKFNPGPGPQSQTSTYTSEDGFIVANMNRVDANGQPVNYTNRYKRDGKEYPYKSRDGITGTVAVKPINERTTEAVVKGGKASYTATTIISPDGRTRTLTIKGTDPQGRKVSDVMVYEKQ